MISYIKNKIEKHKIKTSFKKYGSHINRLLLKSEGEIEFAVWDNPLESPKSITQSAVDFYKKFAPKGCLAIDIGAHIGDTTVPLALAVGKDGITLAFDPNPYVFEILSINAQLNKEKTNILPFNYAIAVEPGEYYYNSSEDTFDNGGISKQSKSKHGKYQLQNKVTAVNLLDFLKKELAVSLEQLRFIKIDVEGLDLEILQSIKDMIFTYRPTISTECFKKLDTDKRYKMYNMFDEMDFQLFKLTEFDANAKVQKLMHKEDMKKWKHFDFCAIPKERVEDVYNKN
ncbi:MAG: hypothetical protein DRI75_12005 [Bacteroidetes bacterium]|nr:MAG: hypothetical protein DRI75_12005 [Bacteroidota bacterium]